MKAITLHQPFASLVAVGAKGYETRSWGTRYRGPLLIHAGKRWDDEVAENCDRARETLTNLRWRQADGSKMMRGGLWSPGPSWHDTLGRILAIAQLTGCHECTGEEWYAPLEEEFGTFGPGRFAWQMEDVRPLVPPIRCRGAQGLWDVPPEIAALIAEFAKAGGDAT